MSESGRLVRLRGAIRKVELLREDGAERQRGRKRKPKDAGEEEHEEHRAIVCRSCETEITDSSAVFAMRADGPIQVFPNPYGHMKKIITVRDAQSVRIESEAIGDFTWFEGYTWRIVTCASCRAHLGWLFETSGGDTPRSFFGLLLEALTER